MFKTWIGLVETHWLNDNWHAYGMPSAKINTHVIKPVYFSGTIQYTGSHRRTKHIIYVTFLDYNWCTWVKHWCRVPMSHGVTDLDLLNFDFCLECWVDNLIIFFFWRIDNLIIKIRWVFIYKNSTWDTTHFNCKIINIIF